jgi:transposase-like protein
MAHAAEQESVGERREWKPVRERVWTVEDAREMEEAWKRSGETVGGFARRHGVGAERLRWWLRRLSVEQQGSKSVPAVRFAPVRVVEQQSRGEDNEKCAPPRGDGALEVLLAGGRVVRIRNDFDAALLRRVVAALEESAC